MGADRYWELIVPGCRLFLCSLDPQRSASNATSAQRSQTEDILALPSSQCGPTALYRRPLAASALLPCLAAPQPGKKNKRASVEEEIKNKKCECKESTWDADWKELKQNHCSGLVYGIPPGRTTNLQHCSSFWIILTTLKLSY